MQVSNLFNGRCVLDWRGSALGSGERRERLVVPADGLQRRLGGLGEQRLYTLQHEDVRFYM